MGSTKKNTAPRCSPQYPDCWERRPSAKEGGGIETDKSPGDHLAPTVPACTVRDASRRGVWRQVAPCDWAASENRWEIMRASWGRRLLRVPNPSRLGVFRFGTAECMCGKWSAR